MWQTLETKAKFIFQIMTGESSARRIEDLESPALTYAEVKAIASGNPLVIEKAKVDAEVMRLSRLHGQHREDQYNTRRRVRMLEDDIVRLERALTGHEADLGRRIDTHGDKFVIRLVGRTYDERTEAGLMLIGLVDRHRSARGPVELGHFAGFRLEFRPTVSDQITVIGTMNYDASVSASPAGIIASLEHSIRTIEDRIARAQNHLVETRKSLAEFSALLNRPFEHEEQYRAATARQGELVQALDITKSQKAEGLATNIPDEAEAQARSTVRSEAPRDAMEPASPTNSSPRNGIAI